MLLWKITPILAARIPCHLILHPDATVLGGEIYGINCDLNRSVLDGYKITFDTNTAHQELDRSEIIGRLIGNQAKSTRDSRYWLLDTGSFCR
jgi:hypothetical protein